MTKGEITASLGKLQGQGGIHKVAQLVSNISSNASNGLTAAATIAATVTPTTAGVTTPSQTLVAGAIYRLRANGVFIAVSSATARNARIAAVWGGTEAVPGASMAIAVQASTARTSTFTVEYILVGSSSTVIVASAIWVNSLAAGTLGFSRFTTGNTTVPSGPRTIDLQFYMSVVVAGDQWNIDSVTIEKLK